ncbi:hypothetical protein ABEG10_13665 [Burkholderia cenocepacia]|uniref:hypothetical protein n=1 Tax=Burkholderia cenocepacia TaxID=95486 RepID=UPI00209FAB0B|nr:hypothetical protein [Burkholderia cenocepacia]MCO8421430.1 hypothetical protein [Burkholderia cenocepacia]MCO8471126.1 hypothetical protein [Burkholderia cenocepacia]MCO8476456.1 hypothetical protein [Burkholderia cenocepacia]MCO8486683.1 hypothetical protein [Burkholderia cenocepacia]MCO8502523.1 hypothetical protein [Burkholderia cenocepacia]
MPKFMNAELIAIRDSLKCGHCCAVFQGSDSQAWKVKYEGKTVYCSTTCRHAALRNKFSTPVPNRGPCPTCNKTFFSRRAKVYCSMDCYVASDQFAAVAKAAVEASKTPEARAANAAARRLGATIKCLECGDEFYKKRSERRKFCTTSCYRSYLAKRFDRWIANPEGMALPQCYDEFLDSEELTCVVHGCTWRGAHLSLHMNQAHGVRAEEFKRAAGFNLGTGVVAKPLARALQQRPLHGIALQDEQARQAMLDASRQPRERYIRYASAESREHRRKAIALLNGEPGPIRICAGCGVEFQQRFALGRALYCTVECRNRAYAAAKKRSGPRQRDSSGRYVKSDTPPQPETPDHHD